MKIAVVEANVVTRMIVVDDGYVIDPDGRSARAQATYTVEDAGGTRDVEYEAVIDAPDGGLLIASGEAGVGWLYENGVLIAPPAPAPTIEELTAHAADTRWQKETGGITVAGVPVATDDRSKQMIIGARVAADADPDWTTQWVGADGVIYPIDAAAIVAISNAVQAHVNACFATFASVKAAIDAATITTMQEIDAAFAS